MNSSQTTSVGLDINNAIRRIADRPRVEGQSGLMATWWSYYRGNYAAKYYEIDTGTNDKTKLEKATLNMPKKVCQDIADFILNKKCEIVIPAIPQKKLNKYLDKIKFWQKANQNYEQALALSMGAWVLGIEGLTVNDEGEVLEKGKIKTRFINATKIYPITYKDGELVECAFAVENTGNIYVECHLLDEKGNYFIRTQTLTSAGNRKGEAQDFYTLSNIKLFSLVYPNIYNNIDVNSNKPISLFANALDNFECLDEKYDDFNIEFKNGKKIIFINESLFKVDTEGGVVYKSFDRNNTLFYRAQFDNNDKPLIETSAEQLREQSYIQAINTEMNLISMQLGLGREFYNINFPKNQQTATAVISMNSEAIRTIKKHEEVVRTALIDFVKAYQYLSNTFTDDPLGDFAEEQIDVLFDDNVFENEEAEQLRDRTNVASGLMTEAEFRMKWYAEDETTAKNWVFKNLRYKLITNYEGAFNGGLMTAKEFVETCYGDKTEQEKNELIEFIENKKQESQNQFEFDPFNNTEEDVTY